MIGILHMLFYTVLLTSFLMTTIASAQEKPFVTTETFQQWEAAKSEGAEYRMLLFNARKAIKNVRLDEARNKIDTILEYCESKKTTYTQKLISVSSLEEFQIYMNSSKAGISVVWVDMVCPAAYKTSAFLYVSNNQIEIAIIELVQARKLAPFWAEPYTEIGYILNKLKQPETAMKAYEKLHWG